MRKIVFLGMMVGWLGCAQATKTAADAVKTEQCVIAEWGNPVETIALDCLGNETQLAIDTVADIETLQQKNGAKPTLAYQKDARVSQIVLARLAAKP